MRRADRARWNQARTLADIGELTAQWLEGKIASRPGYCPGCGPDDETTALIPVLAALNRAGFVTDGSQPGVSGPGCDGTWWQQRAAVYGFTSPEMASRILTGARRAGLHVIAHNPARLPRWRINYDKAEAVTLVDGRRHTGFGAHLSRSHIRGGCGYGECHRKALDALCAAWQVTVIDPEWGRGDRLWPVLTRPEVTPCS